MDKIKNILQLFLSLRGDNFFIALIKKISIEKNINPCKKDLRFFQRWNDEEKSSKILTVKTVIETHQQREREREVRWVHKRGGKKLSTDTSDLLGSHIRSGKFEIPERWKEVT